MLATLPTPVAVPNSSSEIDFLADLYKRNEATDLLSKRKTLEDELGTNSISFFACGGDICADLELACLEREVLIQHGVIRPSLF